MVMGGREASGCEGMVRAVDDVEEEESEEILRVGSGVGWEGGEWVCIGASGASEG